MRWAILLAALLATACTTEQAYNTAQAYQRRQCENLPDKADVDRCMANAAADYDTYRRQSGAKEK